LRGQWQKSEGRHEPYERVQRDRQMGEMPKQRRHWRSRHLCPLFSGKQGVGDFKKPDRGRDRLSNAS
jgi:hypothetical protein